ncbi:hypothetical protein E3N88_09690 [Mikania micrantha]|uniref:DUF4219 domain-containing protein n=1 Tax=Mikania micrantha TaxID=192012 RepID=A0A5N6PJU7_9ASTR|nr:hypothetical protein E3N88_09690 [Mikania micrantha]
MAKLENQALVTVKKSNTLSLQCPVLSSTNYTVWAIRMRVIFNVHGVWEMTKPGTNLDAKKNNLTMALLFLAVPEEQTLQVGNLKTAKEMSKIDMHRAI